MGMKTTIYLLPLVSNKSRSWQKLSTEQVNPPEYISAAEAP